MASSEFVLRCSGMWCEKVGFSTFCVLFFGELLVSLILERLDAIFASIGIYSGAAVEVDANDPSGDEMLRY